MVVFISGHLDLTEEEFQTHYAPKIREHAAAGDFFVIGDADGTDARAQALCAELQATVRVYHMFVAPRNNVGGFWTMGGFKSDRSRDKQMTLDSDMDIAWVRPGREKSGTARNLARRGNLSP